MFYNQEVKIMEDIKSYINKMKTELVMEGYQDGWSVKWIEDKITELEDKLKKYNHKFND